MKMMIYPMNYTTKDSILNYPQYTGMTAGKIMTIDPAFPIAAPKGAENYTG